MALEHLEPWICRTQTSKATGPSKIRKGEVCNLGTKSPTKKALGERKLTAISQDITGIHRFRKGFQGFHQGS